MFSLVGVTIVGVALVGMGVVTSRSVSGVCIHW